MRPLSKGTSPVLSIRVPKGTREKLSTRAAAHGLSRSEYVRLALDVAAGELCCIQRDVEQCPHVRCYECRTWTVMELDDMGYCGHTITPATQHAGERA